MKLTAESTVINDNKLNTDIDNAQETANQAKTVADNTAQYFWFKSTGNDTGAHISEKTQSEFIASPSGGNLLARSNGIAVRDGMDELAVFGVSESAQTIATSIAVGALIPFGSDLTVPALAQAKSGTDIIVDIYKKSDETQESVPKTLAFEKGTSSTVDLVTYDGNSSFRHYNTDYTYTANRIKYYVSTTPPSVRLGTTESDNALSVGQLVSGVNRDIFSVDYEGNVVTTGDITTMGGLDIVGDIDTHSGSINCRNVHCDSISLYYGWMTDYINESGTSGIWTYRKYRGVKECWGTYTASIAITTSAPAYGGYRSGALNIPAFPFEFVSAPTVTATANSATGYWVNNVVPTTSGGTFYLSAGASLSASSRSIAFHVIGV